MDNNEKFTAVGPVPPENRVRVPKGWGAEDWINNANGYCGKILHFYKAKRCSFHYHLVKDEVFYLQSGCLLIEYGPDDDLTNATKLIMFPGDVFHVPPGMRHRMTGMEESDLFEFSTTHRDEDSIRVVRGD
jgi:mannose-6-phosphate isomerase-like protein (cupin superfamily)